MARGKDLAGLASLAGLAYLASQGKGNKGADRDTDTGVDVQPSYAQPTPASVAPTPASMADENYSNEGRREGPIAVGRAPAPVRPTVARPAARPMGGSGRGGQGGATAEELAAYASSKKPTYETPYDRARREDREAGRDIGSVVESLKNRIATAGDRGEVLKDARIRKDEQKFMGSGMKKGGKVKEKTPSVKGWGIARGARKAKMY